MKQPGQHEGAGESPQQLHVQRKRDKGGASAGLGDEEEVELGQRPREARDDLEQQNTGDYNNLKICDIIITRGKIAAQIADDPESDWGPIICNRGTISGTIGVKFNFHYENHN